MTAPLTVAVHERLREWHPEIAFVLRTLGAISGYPMSLNWISRGGGAADLYYGPAVEGLRCGVWIPSANRRFADAPSVQAASLIAHGDNARLELNGVRVDARGMAADLVFDDDVVFQAYWLLTGAREPFYPRSPVGDLDFEGSPLVRNGALDTPLVSLWGARLRRHFESRGHQPVPHPWAETGRAAFAFTHDVDYPEILRWIEVPRRIAQGRIGEAWRIARGRSHHWTFDEWVTFERDLGARPCFYFMARQGSLLQYATGTPDDFYDVRAPQFTDLFQSLRDAGAEIGLHASFHAHRDASVLREEARRISSASGARVHGNRHHYWHLDPDDPNTTLARHAEAGLEYDSSLGLEYYPGFRRGICHPFRPFHPATRKVIDTIQIPPAWMDDHFDRRLAKNGIGSPDEVARGLVDCAVRTGGLIVVDYHSRGMNREFFPRWGEWLEQFARTELLGKVAFHLPHELAAMFRSFETTLADASTGLSE